MLAEELFEPNMGLLANDIKYQPRQDCCKTKSTVSSSDQQLKHTSTHT